MEGIQQTGTHPEIEGIEHADMIVTDLEREHTYDSQRTETDPEIEHFRNPRIEHADKTVTDLETENTYDSQRTETDPAMNRFRNPGIELDLKGIHISIMNSIEVNWD